MPFAKIAAVATATPPHRFTQSQVLTLADYRDEERSGFFRRSDIDGRYLWIDPATFRPDESIDELSARFRAGALEQAANYLTAFPGRRALVIAVEICSAAYFLDDRLESAVAHAIFADGAGALAVTTGGPGPSLVAQRTLFRPEHLDAMGFEYPPHRCHHDGRDGGHPDVGAGAQARGHPLLGPALRGAARDRPRPHLARAQRRAGRSFALRAATLRQHVIGHDPLRPR